jgi:hypothetical protein
VERSKTTGPAVETPEQELVALAVLPLRRQASSQSELAREMYAVGFGPSRIAALLGTTSNTINQAIQKDKKKSKGPKAKGNGRAK